MKKKAIQPQRQLKPDEYVRTKARQLPIYKCYVNDYWLNTGLTMVIIARQHKTGNFTLGYYYADTYYRGLFNSGTYFNYTQKELDYYVSLLVSHSKDKHMVVEIDYSLAHNIIYGALDLAKKNGFEQCKNFETAKYILEDNDGKVEYIDVGFGKNEFRQDKSNDNVINVIVEQMITW